MLEDPAEAGAARRGGAGDDELFGRVRAAFAVDPQAFLDRERALGRAELPQRPAGDAQQAAQSVGGQAGRNMGPKVKTQHEALVALAPAARGGKQHVLAAQRSEEHTSELQSLMRISYAVFCLKKKK